MRSVSVSSKGRKLDPSRHRVVEKDKDADCDESSESTGVRSRVIARLIAPTPMAVPCERAAPVGGRGTAVATSLRGAAMKEIPDSRVHSSAGTPGDLPCLRPLCKIGRVNAASPGALVESSRILFLGRTRRMITLCLSWEGGLPAS